MPDDKRKLTVAEPDKAATLPALTDPNKQAATSATSFRVPLKLFPGRLCFYGFISAVSATGGAGKPNNDLAGNA